MKQTVRQLTFQQRAVRKRVSRAPPRTWSLQGASAALSGTAGRSRSWSVPGQGLAHTYEVDPDRQAAHRWPACCPRPTKGSSRRARWRPRAAQKRSPPGSRQALTAVLIRYEPAALPSPRRRRVFWSFLHLNFSAFSPLAGGGEQPCTRTRTSCGCSGRYQVEGDELPRGWRASRRCSSSRPGSVNRRVR